MDDAKKDLVPREQNLEIANSNDLLRDAVRQLDADQRKRISEKATEAALNLQVQGATAEQNFQNASRDMEAFVQNVHQLDRGVPGRDYTADASFQSASGTTNIRVTRRTSTVTVVVAVVIGLVLLLLFMTRH